MGRRRLIEDEFTKVDASRVIDPRPDSLGIMEREEGRRALILALGVLTRRERVVLLGRFGFGGVTYTGRELGEMYSVSRSRIQQLEREALRKLRKPGPRRGLPGLGALVEA